MRYLVTGAAGFVGARLCRRLLRDGDEVVAYVHSGGRELEQLLSIQTAQEVMVRGDITDGLHLLRVAKERRVDAIIHLATLLAGPSSENPGLAVRVNCEGMVNVLEAARILGLRKVVWASTAGVYALYRHGNPIANDAPYAPNNIYSATKVLNEVLARSYADSHGVDVIGIRLTLMAGVGRPRAINGAITTELIEKPVRGLPGRVPYGDDTGNWLWVEDACRALALAAHAERTSSRVFNIGGDVRSMREAADIVRRVIPGADITLEPGTAGLYHVLDTTPIEKELGFRSQWRLEDQIQELINQARSVWGIDAPEGNR